MQKSMKESVISATNENSLVNIGAKQMQSREKLSGIKIDSEWNFKDHIGRVCPKNQCQIKCFDQTVKLHESW